MREELAARLPEETLRRTHADAAAPPLTASLSKGSPATWVRAGRARDAVPLLTEAADWAAGVGAYRDGAEWAELALEHVDEQQRPVLFALRSQLLHGAGRGPRRCCLCRGDRGRARGTRARVASAQAGACLAAGKIRGAKAALERAQPRGRRPGRANPAAQNGGMAYRRLGARARAGRRGGPHRSRPRRSCRPERHVRLPGRRLGAAFPAPAHACLGLAGAREPRLRRLPVRHRVGAHGGRSL